MKQIKVSEATGPALDWLVAKCEGKNITLMRNDDGSLFPRPVWADGLWQQDYSTNWTQIGPIVEREGISIIFHEQGHWTASNLHGTVCVGGPTPLIAAMRCFCANRLGDTAEVPEELT